MHSRWRHWSDLLSTAPVITLCGSGRIFLGIRNINSNHKNDIKGGPIWLMHPAAEPLLPSSAIVVPLSFLPLFHAFQCNSRSHIQTKKARAIRWLFACSSFSLYRRKCNITQKLINFISWLAPPLHPPLWPIHSLWSSVHRPCYICWFCFLNSA